MTTTNPPAPAKPKKSSTLDSKPASLIARIGEAVVFVAQSIYLVPVALMKYRGETSRVLKQLAWGRGSVVVDGGVVVMMVILGAASGAAVAIEAYAGLNLIGFGPLTGVIGGLANIREMIPISAGIGFAAQAGCRMTAQIGSMRIAEEIDAVEALGIRSIPYVVSTRLIAGIVVVIPAYLLTLLLAFLTCKLIVVVFHGQALGTYNHYFEQFLSPGDIALSTLKAVVFCAAVTIIHCYYGFFAKGGPEGVGLASGRAVRASLVTVLTLDFILTIMFWGITPTIIFKG
ncbi:MULTISPECIES: MlaE family ABC transporter permease [Tsukamurella]|uniref:ABC transporter permease n=2 Tax=Tsukamurella TaxID=2060 RepID=A0A5C5S4Z6_9ACTN|nr:MULTISPECIES: ABC transporter permease [Tsukamurella]NMD55824.1 ABC transporter permease [Tsukamurella columbiensis]TWS30507.1 ABC transporter permease [Tsukamurella conjunctivitidis]